MDQNYFTLMLSDHISPLHPLCRYSPKNPSLVSETVHYKRGVSQQFSMPSFKIDFSEWKEEDVSVGNQRNFYTTLRYEFSVPKRVRPFPLS